MIRLLKIELNKVLYYKIFWVIFGLYLILLAPTAYAFESILKSVTTGDGSGSTPARIILQNYSIFNFPSIWHNISYLFGWFQLFLAIIIVSLVTNEYNFKTLSQNIADGMSKWEIIWAKELVILVLSIISVCMLILLTIMLGKKIEGTNIFEGTNVVFAYFITLVLFLNFAYFVSSWLKKSGFAIGVILLYGIVEKIVSLKLPESVSQLLPMNLINNIIPNPFGAFLGKNVSCDLSFLNISMCVFYITLFICTNYWMLVRGHAGK